MTSKLNTPWSQEDIDLLAKMTADGADGQAIAYALGRSQQTIYVQRRKFKLVMKRSTCQWCDAAIDQPRYGRPRKYCSAHSVSWKRILPPKSFIVACAQCGEPFDTIYPFKKYCSRVCGVRAWYDSKCQQPYGGPCPWPGCAQPRARGKGGSWYSYCRPHVGEYRRKTG